METFLNPTAILNELKLRPSMLAAEFGCGSGGFVLPLAKILEDGFVFAIDIQMAPLSALKSKALSERVNNIKIVCSDLEKPRGSSLNDLYLDLVLIPNLLFQVTDKKVIISEALRILKKNAKLAIIDWHPSASQGPEGNRISPEEIKTLCQQMGLSLEKEINAGKYHYCLVFIKK
jgi:ubiquinone/menaquinone biosynthesis C-methylase UbiE